MSRAVSGRSSAIRNATSDSWRISLSVSCDNPRRAYSPIAILRGDFASFEVLMRGAVVALGERRALARLALPRRRVAAGNAAFERAVLDLLLDELDRSPDAVRDRPGDLRLHGDREVAPDVLEERLVRLGEVMRVGSESLHRALAGSEHLAPVVELGPGVDIGVDEVFDRPIDRA